VYRHRHPLSRFGTLNQSLILPESTCYKADLEVKQAQCDAEVPDDVVKLNVKRSARGGAQEGEAGHLDNGRS
jgi:hypothetical protein